MPRQVRPVLTRQRNETAAQRLNIDPARRVTPAAPGPGEFTDNETYREHFDVAPRGMLQGLEDEARDGAGIGGWPPAVRRLRPVTPNDAYVSCTTFDARGNVVAVSRRYPKMKFLKENNLFPRDLRKIDTSLVDVVPLVVARAPSSIVVNLLHIKAIIKRDRVMIFDTLTPQIAQKLGLFMYDLEMKLRTSQTSERTQTSERAQTSERGGQPPGEREQTPREPCERERTPGERQSSECAATAPNADDRGERGHGPAHEGQSGDASSALAARSHDASSALAARSHDALASPGLPYEFRALETILISVMLLLDADLRLHTQQCGSILDELEDQIDRNKLRALLIRSKSLASYYQKAVLIRDVLDELLDSDDVLAAMHLLEPKSYDPAVENPMDYQELEMLLEAYYNHCDEFVQQAGSLLNDIRATEEIVNIILDANRNLLMLFELKVTVYTLGFTVATLVPAFYGMNLRNYIEELAVGFGAVALLLVAQGAAVTWFMFRKLRGVQRLTMMGGASMAPMRAAPRAPPPPPLALPLWRRRLQRWLYGDRNTRFDRPTVRERDAMWRMINDDKPLRVKPPHD
jgi:hypothetical protein